MRIKLPATLIVFVSAVFLSTAGFAFDPGAANKAPEIPPARVLGTLSFPTLAKSEEAQEAFIQGMLLLHLFEYPFARKQFQLAQALEPGFAMAVWGEAMTHNQPIWGRQDRDAARSVLQKLGATPNERQDATPSARGKLLIGALETLYGDGPKAERDRAYLRRMEQLAARFPEDHEIQLFYALAVFGVHAGVRDIDSYLLATAIADSVFAQNPSHPGAAHYLIHGVDDPVHAILGLRAARALAEMAPDAPHAQHMTSHIFNALGMWDDMVIANEAAVSVNNRYRMLEGGTATHTGHYNAWLIYGYLQQGRFAKARELLESAHAQAQAAGRDETDPLELSSDRSVVASAVHMWMRYLIETGEWEGEIAGWTFRLGEAFNPNLNYNFVQAMRSAFGSLPSKAQDQLDQFVRLREELKTLVRRQSEPKPTDLMFLDRLDIMEKQVQAVIELSKGEYADAVPYALQASNLEGELPRAYGPPFIDYPSAQLLGEVYASNNQHAAALAAFELELDRNRQRSAALMGLIRAHQSLGNDAEAQFYMQKLALIWHLADEPVRARLQ